MADLISLLYFLLIGLAAGWLAGRFVEGHGLGLGRNLLVGVVGALLGGFLFSLIGLAAVGLLGSLVSATAGAVVLLLILQRVRI